MYVSDYGYNYETSSDIDGNTQYDAEIIPLPRSRRHFDKISVRNYLYSHEPMYPDLEDVSVAAFHVATSNAQYAFNAHRMFSLTFFRGFHHPLVAEIVAENTCSLINEYYPELRVVYKIDSDHEYIGTFRIEMKIDFEQQ